MRRWPQWREIRQGARDLVILHKQVVLPCHAGSNRADAALSRRVFVNTLMYAK
jgi:hypothetical protein